MAIKHIKISNQTEKNLSPFSLSIMEVLRCESVTVSIVYVLQHVRNVMM